MSSRWQYGNYIFRINPNNFSSKSEVVGDDVRTITGALISQPTTVNEQYDIESVFYQARSRILKTQSIANASFLEYYSGNFYGLDASHNIINIYNSNLSSVVNTISLANCAVKSFSGLDVSNSNSIWVSSTSGNSDYFYNLNSSGGIIASYSISDTNQNLSGIENFNGYLWILRNNGDIQQISIPSFTVANILYLPNGINYYGLSSDGNYLIAGNNDYNTNSILHIDTNIGQIVNNINPSDGVGSIFDVTYDGNYFYTLNTSNSTLKTISGNTVGLDAHNLELQINNYSRVNMIDDMGVTRYVYVSRFSSQRMIGFEGMYNVQMTIDYVDRGR